MVLRWLLSRTVRQATNSCRHVRKNLEAQRDLLGQQALDTVLAALREVRREIASGTDPKALRAKMGVLEKVAAKWLKPHPHAAIRENTEVVLVAVSVALAIRTFFLQPFKIPTGSMQPTLYGIVVDDLRGLPDAKIPSGLERIYDTCVKGISYCHRVAEADGVFETSEPPRLILPFLYRQRIKIG